MITKLWWSPVRHRTFFGRGRPWRSDCSPIRLRSRQSHLITGPDLLYQDLAAMLDIRNRGLVISYKGIRIPLKQFSLFIDKSGIAALRRSDFRSDRKVARL